MSDRRKSRRSYSRSRSKSRSRSRNRKQSKTSSSSYHHSSSSNYGSSSNGGGGGGSSSSRRNNESSSHQSSKNTSSTSGGGSSRNDSQFQYSSVQSSSLSSNNKDSKEQKSSSHNKSSSNKESKKSSHNKKDSRSRSRSKSRPRTSSKSPSQDEKKKQGSRDKLQSSSQQWNFKAIYDESKWLIIDNLPETVEQKDIEEKLTQVSADCGTSIFDEIKLVPYMGSAYILYPSVSAASKTLYHLKGKVKLKDQYYQIDFYNTTTSANGSGVGGGANGTKAASVYDNMQTDWICDKCEYKNFAKRAKCNKCEKQRSSNCRQVLSNIGSKSTGAPTCGAATSSQGELTSSLMIRGSVVLTINESHLIDAFERYAKIKDVRLVKNKQTLQQKDFAFVEFYTIEDAEKVLALTNVPEFRVAGEVVTVLISRNKKSEEQSQGFVASSSSASASSAIPYDYQQSYPSGGQYDYSQYYQQIYQQYNQPSTYIDYDAVGYSAYDQQQQQMQQVYTQSDNNILPTSPYKTIPPPQIQNQLNSIPFNPLLPQTASLPINNVVAQNQQPTHLQQQSAHLQQHSLAQLPAKVQQQPAVNFDVNTESFSQSDLIKQALENVKNHSLSLLQQKEEQSQKLIQQQQEEQKKKEQAEKNFQIQKTMEDQKKLLEEQQKALKKNVDENKMKDISQRIKEKQEEQLKQEQRMEKLKLFSLGAKYDDIEQDYQTIDESSNKQALLQFETNAFNSTSVSSQPTKVIDIQLSLKSSSSQHKERLYLCSICKRKFESDRVINIHYHHSQMHKDNLKLYGLY